MSFPEFCEEFAKDCKYFGFLLIDKEKEATNKAEGVADDEGWIKVTHLSKNKASRTDSHDKRTKRKLKKRKQEKV